ncbi:FAD-dependent oxidoreductase [Brachybacterium rhamnosum]|uniref:NAD(P)/FAD-dependent oxidoreductase n=1 Tax=Brachybacterium rhamnosum TaxID=173361 RepID=A0ABW4PXJ5_9MICO
MSTAAQGPSTTTAAESTTPEDRPDPQTVTADVVVIGGGPVGENLAQYAIEGTDLTAVIVERELMGGECSYYACMPSKALLRPIDVAHTAAHLDGLTTPRIEPAGLLARRDAWVSGYDDAGQVSWAEGAGIRVVRGHAVLTGERELRVGPGEGPAAGADAVTVRARRRVVIATGSVPVIPEAFTGLEPWTSRDATGVVEVPASLAIVGGGVVAVEAATWMAALGSEVTVIVRGEGLLGAEEPFAGIHVREALEAAGVTVLTGTTVASARRERAEATGLGRVHGGEVTLELSGGDAVGEARTLTAAEVLVATGRRPRLDDVGLDALGLTPQDVTSGGLPSWLAAVGDASGEAPLTHWGKYRARVLGAAIRAEALREQGQPDRADGADGTEPVPEEVPVPQVIFTDPQVARVGLTERAAWEAGHEVVTAQVPFTGAAGTALLRDDAAGTAQIVVDAATRTLLGATLVGPEAGELIHAATVAIVGRVPVRVLRHAVASYPSASEIWLRLLEELPREYRVR